MLQPDTMLAMVVPVGAGVLGLGSGAVAAFAPRGGWIRDEAGEVFFASMATMAVFAAYHALAGPAHTVDLFIAAFTLYLVATAWMAARRSGAAGLPEKLALAIAVLLCAPFAALSFELATGLSPFFISEVPLEGPAPALLYGVTALLAAAAAADARLVFGRSSSQAVERISSRREAARSNSNAPSPAG